MKEEKKRSLVLVQEYTPHEISPSSPEKQELISDERRKVLMANLNESSGEREKDRSVIHAESNDSQIEMDFRGSHSLFEN